MSTRMRVPVLSFLRPLIHNLFMYLYNARYTTFKEYRLIQHFYLG
jgi:hypothetical protein